MWKKLRLPNDRGLREMDSVELVSACAVDRENSALWGEFVRRFGPKIKQFIRGTLRISMRSSAFRPGGPVAFGLLEEGDLFQNTILKLVEQDCKVIRRFSGTTEEEWLAYLAVVSRSVVRDNLRRQRAQKRPLNREDLTPLSSEEAPEMTDNRREHFATERRILARELGELFHRMSGSPVPSADRDRLIFQLYFFHDLSTGQIAGCKGVNLSKAGVEKVLKRLKERVRSAASIGVSGAM